MFAVNSVTALDMVSEAGIGWKILQAGVMKFVRAD
jgi:hypothetical protein